VRERVGQVERITLPFRVFSHRLSLTLFIGLSVALLLLGRAEAYVFDEARTKVAEVTAPIMEILSTPLAIVREWVGDVRDYFNVYEENRRLKEENARLMAWKAAALRMEQTAARYEALLNVQLEPGIGYVTGRVIADSGGPFVNTYIVNAGREDGVAKGQAVVDTEGLIGRVIGTGDKASRVLLITDLNSRVPVLIEPSHYRAVMAGNNSANPRLLYVSDETEINSSEQVEIDPDQRVVTSGHGGMFPPGLPIGVVVRASDGEYRVQPYSDQGRVDFVRMLQYDFPRDIEPESDPDEAPEEASTENDASQVGLLTSPNAQSEE